MHTSKDLTKVSPVSPRERVGGFALLPRTIDKAQAELWGNVGEYHFDCPFDNVLFAWKGIKGSDLKAYIAEGHTNEGIAAWVKSNGIPKTDAEIQEWSDRLEKYDLSHDAGKQAWLEGTNVKLGLDAKAPLMDMLVADDAASFPQK